MAKYAKVLHVGEKIVEIGEGDGVLTELKLSDLNFVPRVGDMVEIYRSEKRVRVILVDPGKFSPFASWGWPFTKKTWW